MKEKLVIKNILRLALSLLAAMFGVISIALGFLVVATEKATGFLLAQAEKLKENEGYHQVSA